MFLPELRNSLARRKSKIIFGSYFDTATFRLVRLDTFSHINPLHSLVSALPSIVSFFPYLNSGCHDGFHCVHKSVSSLPYFFTQLNKMTLLQAQSYPGRNLIPSRDFPQTISSVEELDEVIMTRLRHLGGSSQTDSMRIAFAIIHHARLTPTVLKVLRSTCLFVIAFKLMLY